MDKRWVCFGEVLSGMDIVSEMEEFLLMSDGRDSGHSLFGSFPKLAPPLCTPIYYIPSYRDPQNGNPNFGKPPFVEHNAHHLCAFMLYSNEAKLFEH